MSDRRRTRFRNRAVQLRELASVRFKEYSREPEALFWSFVFPVLLAIGLGLAFRERPPEVVQVGLVADGRQMGVAGIFDSLAAAPLVQVHVFPSDGAAHDALRTGRVALVVAPTEGGGVEYRLDETRPEARVARSEVDAAVQRAAGRVDPVPATTTQVRERGSRYIDFLIPGLLGMTIMGGGMWGIGFTIVDARRKHLLKRLVATPMSRALYLLSFLVSRFMFLIIEVVVLLGVGVLLFNVPIRGSIVQLLLAAVAAALTFSALGLLVSARPRTIEGASGVMNLTMMPMWVLSGIFFSASNFPDSLQPLIQALPLTAAIDAMRGTMLLGAGWAEVGPEFAIMTAWTVVAFVAALRLFRWR
jgi:ABC-2 type transport system permease protein